MWGRRQRRARGRRLPGSQFGRFGAAASLLDTEGTGWREINTAALARDASGSGAGSRPESRAVAGGGTYKKGAKKKENQQNRLMNPNEVCWKPGLLRGGGGSWIPDFNLHGEPQQHSPAPLGARSRRCCRLWARGRSPPWSRIRGGHGAGGGLQRRAGDLMPDAIIAHEGGCPLVAVAVLALHVADAVGRVAVVSADVAGVGHGAACAAPVGRGEPRQHPSVLSSAQWHPSAPIGAWMLSSAWQCPEAPIGTPLVSVTANRCLVALISICWCPSVPSGTHQYLMAPTSAHWGPLVPISTQCHLLVPIGAC